MPSARQRLCSPGDRSDIWLKQSQEMRSVDFERPKVPFRFRPSAKLSASTQFSSPTHPSADSVRCSVKAACFTTSSPTFPNTGCRPSSATPPNCSAKNCFFSQKFGTPENEGMAAAESSRRATGILQSRLRPPSGQSRMSCALEPCWRRNQRNREYRHVRRAKPKLNASPPLG
jgi:hypothetical protein